jgi:DNA-binding response OmpR family regulator/tetratricopeptide (TPR) repeat protein
MSKVLIVEDDKYLNKLLHDRFVREGFETESCLDGISAWLRLVEEAEAGKPFDILICDMLLPRLSGEELLKRIREKTELNTLKIICISGVYKDKHQIEEFRRIYDLESYLTKPFEISDLVLSVSGNLLFNDKEESLTGQLENTPIEKVFFQAYQKGFTGVLELKRENITRKVYFKTGFPIAAQSTALAENLGPSLVSMKIITKDVREEAARRMVEEKCQFGQMLIKMTALTKDGLFEALRKHTFRVLMNTFSWRQATFEATPLKELPSHILQIEFNPMLLMLKAQKVLYQSDFIKSLFENKSGLYGWKSKDLAQVLPLFQPEDPSKRFFKKLAGHLNLDLMLAEIADEDHEEILRQCYLFESLGLLEWKTEPSKEEEQEESFSHADFEEVFQNEEELAEDKAKLIQAEYLDIASKDYFQILDAHPRTPTEQIEATYIQMRDRWVAEQNDPKIPGQIKRIIDDMLARLEQAHSVLRDKKEKKKYAKGLKRHEKESLSDSKNYLRAQELFRKGQQFLRNQNFTEAKRAFDLASDTWKQGFEFRLYSCFTELRLNLLDDNRKAAEECLEKLETVAKRQPNLAVVHLLLGHSFVALGKSEDASAAYQRNQALDPQSDEVSDALASLGTKEFRETKINRALIHHQKKIKKGAIFAGALAAGIMLIFIIQASFQKDKGVYTIDPHEFTAFFPDTMSVEHEGKDAMLTLKKGWISTVPRTVLQSKCAKALKKAESFGLQQIYLVDKQDGVKAACNDQTFTLY